MTLSVSDLVRLETTSRLLLNPFVASDPEAWLAEAGLMVAELVGGDAALITVPASTREAQRTFSPNDERLGTQMAGLVRDVTASGMTFHDPVIAAWYAAHQAHTASTRAMSRHVVEPHGYRLEDSLFVSEIAAPLGYHDWTAMHERTASGDAGLVVFAHHGRTMRFESAVGDVLQTLMPSFRSGLDTFARFGAQRAALDAVAEPLAVFSVDGLSLYRNPALSTLLNDDPERATLETQVDRLGRQLGGFVGPFAGGPMPADETLTTARGRYVLRSAALPPGLFGPDPAALVTVAASVAPSLPDAATVRERLGLTKREAEVALLIAEGLSNADVAERLFVSPHTARHHVENVLAKLCITSRAAVTGRLLQAA